MFGRTGLEGEVHVFRECLVDGPLKTDGKASFWRMRGDYLSAGDPRQIGFYEVKVRRELEAFFKKVPESEINLWFEHELFCQVNLWFCLHRLRDTGAEPYVVYPVHQNEDEIWDGFGRLNAEQLLDSFARRMRLGSDEIAFGAKLFEAFRDRDLAALSSLGRTGSRAFPRLGEIVEAAVRIETRPRTVLLRLIGEGERDFGKLFQKFSETEKIYGLGDLQVRRIYDEITGRSRRGRG